MKRVFGMAALGCMLLLVACGSKDKTTTAAYKPTLAVDVKVEGKDATVTVTTDMKIDKDHLSMQRQSGYGHIHLYLDDGEKMIVTDNATTFKNLTPGKHEVKVSLHNNDHTPYDVNQNVTFEIK